MLTYGLKVALLGMGTVFVALYVLMLLIGVQSSILAPKPKKKVEEVKTEAAPVEPAPTAPTEAKEDEDEIRAVIAAAIAACGQNVVIKTITRVTGTSGTAWAANGRTDAMRLRQL